MRRRRYNRFRPRSQPKIPEFLLQCFFSFLLAVGAFAPMLLIFHLRTMIALSDPGVIASWASASLFWSMPLEFYLIITLGYFFSPWIHRKPLRHRERPCYGIEAAKRLRKVGAILWSIGFIFVLLLSLLSLSGRECLTRDGRLQRYNMFNRLIDEYTAEDVSNIRLRTVKESGRYEHDYTYSIRLYVEGEEFYFDRGSFFLGERGTLLELLSIRERHEPNVSIDTTPEKLERVVHDQKLNEEETALLYQLFDQTS